MAAQRTKEGRAPLVGKGRKLRAPVSALVPVRVRKRDDGFLPLQVPHDGRAPDTGGGQDVLHLAVPRELSDLRARGIFPV